MILKQLMEKLIDAEVEDIIETDDHFVCITQPEDYHRVLHHLETNNIEVEQSSSPQHAGEVSPRRCLISACMIQRRSLF